ncbi:hypothetical protein [Flavobacterium salmonis]|nr:hypothetical protein [Flavobacterium salmonis]
MFEKNLKIDFDNLLPEYPKVSHCIKKYYPIGITRENKDYFDYSGIKELNAIIEKNILDDDYYKKEWDEGFINELKLKLNFQDIRGTTAGLVPNFSGVITLEKTLESRTELHFYKSLIGNYFTIEILENIHSKEISHPIFGNRKIWAIENIVTSPVGKYKSLFERVYQLIIEKYNEAKFLPYIFDLYKVKLLDVPYKSDGEEVTIAGAFFQKYSSYNDSINIIGDIKYKLDELK